MGCIAGTSSKADLAPINRSLWFGLGAWEVFFGFLINFQDYPIMANVPVTLLLALALLSLHWLGVAIMVFIRHLYIRFADTAGW